MITRTCKGKFVAAIFLNRKELKAVSSLLDAYIRTDKTDPELPILKQLYSDLQGGKDR